MRSQTVFAEMIRIALGRDVELWPGHPPTEWADTHYRMVSCDFPLSLTQQEGALLYAAILKNHFRMGMEIGTGFGVSAAWIAAGLQENGGWLTTLDNYLEERAGTPEYGDRDRRAEDGFGKCIAQSVACELGLAIKFLVGRSPQDIKNLLHPEARFDFLFIDGEHFKEAPYLDFVGMLPYLADRCIVAFHDVRHASDVHRACDKAACDMQAAVRQYETKFCLRMLSRGGAEFPDE